MPRLYTILLTIVSMLLWGAGLHLISDSLETEAFVRLALPALAGLAAAAFLGWKGAFTSRLPSRVRQLLNTLLALALLVVLATVYADVLMADGSIYADLLDAVGLGAFSSLAVRFGAAFALVHPVLFLLASGVVASSLSRRDRRA